MSDMTIVAAMKPDANVQSSDLYIPYPDSHEQESRIAPELHQARTMGLEFPLSGRYLGKQSVHHGEIPSMHVP